MASEVLALTAGLPPRHLSPGDELYRQGDASDIGISVLVDGSLRIELDDVVLSHIDAPGAFVGEIGALLGTPRTARVVASEPTTVRSIGDPSAFFATHPQLALELARQLAGRLQRLMAYLGDVRAQYGDAGGHLGMLDTVLGKLATRAPVEIEPGSDRAADYDY
jgi:CRP/FNR family transcriptional regulator, cyclic AMP receptor protein